MTKLQRPIIFLILILATAATFAQAQSMTPGLRVIPNPQAPKKTPRPRPVAVVPGVPGPERSALERFVYKDDEAMVIVSRQTGPGILRVSISVGFKMATSERSQSRQEAMMIGAECDAAQTVNMETHFIVIGGPKMDRVESYRVTYYASGENPTKVASMDAKTSLLGAQAERRALRFIRLAYERGERSEER